MSLKDIKDAIIEKKIIFGLRESLKNIRGKKKAKVYVVSDAREDTFKKLKERGVEVESLKKKQDVAKELNLDFECEVFLVK